MADMTWPQAVMKVMREQAKPLHYAEIAQIIIDKGYRTSTGATPANTVATTLHNELKKGAKSKVVRLEPAIYALIETLSIPADETVAEPALDETETIESEKNPIKAFGMYWRRDLVYWQGVPRLLGAQLSGSKEVNFANQAGIYLLHSATRVVYVGQAVEKSLGARLYQHTRDRLSGRWERFSWFGVRAPRDDGLLVDTPEIKFGIKNIITAMEALMIEGLEPPQNRQQGEGFAALEFIQTIGPEVHKKLMIRQIQDWDLA